MDTEKMISDLLISFYIMKYTACILKIFKNENFFRFVK